MNWFYAENGAQKGPVNDEVFQALVATGTIGPDTLVWREGLADWLPYSRVAPPPAAPAAPADTPPPIGAAPVVGASVVCSECARTVPVAETLQIGGQTVCASCKPRVVQRLVEGADATTGTVFNPDVFLETLRQRGGYRVNGVAAADRAFELVKANFWPCIGVTLLVQVIIGASSQIPCLGIIAQFVMTGPLMGGLYIYFLRQLRGKPATLNEAFRGFRQPLFKELALGSTIKSIAVAVIVVMCLAPGFIFMIANPGRGNEEQVLVFFLVGGVPGGLIAAVVGLMWFPSTVIIADKGIGFWPAMELSRKLVFMQFWGWVGFFIVGFFVMLLGFLALCVGLLVATPVFAAMLAVVWDNMLRRADDTTASVAA